MTASHNPVSDSFKGPMNGDKDHLETQLHTVVNTLAETKFLEQHRYFFDISASQCKPPKATGKVKTLKHLCSIDDPVRQPNQARDYINSLFKT